MSKNKIKKLIEKGESESLELKPSLSQIKEIIQTIAGLVNKNGGKIIIGAYSKGNILGLQIGKDTIERLTNKISTSLEPKIYPKIEVKEIDGKKIIIIEVSEAKEKPVFAFGRVFKRVGKSTLRMSRQEIERLIVEKKKVYWDEQICEEAALKDIDEEKIKWFLRKAKYERNFNVEPETPVGEALERLGLIKNGKLTNAAILLFGKKPQRFFLQAQTRCARFKGIKPLEFIDMKVFEGNIINQRDDAVEFVKEHIKLHAKIVGIERVEKWEYPIEAIREAITNAICHRDYEISSNVQVRIFDDRIEVWGVGPLPNPLRLEDLKKKHDSILRNHLIGKCFFLIKFIEQWGTGTNRIIEECLKHGLPEPLFEEITESLVITFWKTKLTEKFLEELNLNERQIKAIEYLKEYKKITSKKYAELFKITERMARNDLKGLADKKVIQKRGVSDKLAYYVLAEI
ncbi:helix-turn-helix domain-containing protein [Patescibacteria group bacterium AH-259-L05]|nr:helix-turn-helix domain-containing protein [Patescibacteria group bacterium AH-259-L05]